MNTTTHFLANLHLLDARFKELHMKGHKLPMFTIKSLVNGEMMMLVWDKNKFERVVAFHIPTTFPLEVLFR